jgi:hypothetical protein
MHEELEIKEAFTWQSIQGEYAEFKEWKGASKHVGQGLAAFCRRKKKKYSESTLGRWGRLLAEADTCGATVESLDADLFPTTKRGLNLWKLSQSIG